MFFAFKPFFDTTNTHQFLPEYSPAPIRQLRYHRPTLRTSSALYQTTRVPTCARSTVSSDVGHDRDQSSSMRRSYGCAKEFCLQHPSATTGATPPLRSTANSTHHDNVCLPTFVTGAYSISHIKKHSHLGHATSSPQARHNRRSPCDDIQNRGRRAAISLHMPFDAVHVSVQDPVCHS